MSQVIEFIGIGRAGKSTQVRLLKNALIKKGHSVKVITDRQRASTIHVPVTEYIGYKIVFAAKALDQYFSYKDKNDFIIVERGFHDIAVWFDAEKRLSHIQPIRANELRNTFLEYTKAVDKVIFLDVTPQKAAERQEKIREQMDDRFEDFIVGPYPKALGEAYLEYKKGLKNILHISGADSKKNIHEKIISFVLKK
ncbi:MAG TPA: hypothetical protein VJB13_01720 [Candidatus Nanoarchaeia archaeon]|nr:hypothetical protein [Candidatus Nanoarchaeia archaeon]